MKRSFSKNKSVLCSSISSFLEEEGLNDIKLEHIFRESDNRRQVLDKLYRVPVPVSKCRITGLHDKDVEVRSEEHTSELQSRGHLVCRLLLEKKKYKVHVIVSSSIVSFCY